MTFIRKLMMSKLWIIGDSYCFTPPSESNENIWSVSLAKKLNYDLENISSLGTCQDWSMFAINHEKHKITVDDQIVIVLTDPARFWFFEDMPDITNSWITDFDKAVGSDRAKAAEGYFKYIQRPSLDILMLNHRLGWLNNLSSVKKWKKIIVIRGFEQFIPDIEEYTNLQFAIGDLYKVSYNEGVLETAGTDIRFNHLCLSNHKILSDKIANSIISNNDLDLTTGFIENIYSKEMLKDPELCKAELCQSYLEFYRNKSTWRDKFLNKTN